MTEDVYIKADPDASEEFKEMVAAANMVVNTYFSAAEKHELCLACTANFMVRIFEDLSKLAPHSDDVGKGNVDQVGNA